MNRVRRLPVETQSSRISQAGKRERAPGTRCGREALVAGMFANATCPRTRLCQPTTGFTHRMKAWGPPRKKQPGARLVCVR